MRSPLTRALLRVKRAEMMRQYDRMAAAQWLPQEVLSDHSRQGVSAILRHAARHVPYFRDFSSQAGLDPTRIGADDLGKFPLLSKRDLMDRQERFLADGFCSKDIYSSATGGSSGTWFKFAVDRSALDKRVANAMRGATWTGWRPGEKQAVLWGHPRENMSYETIRSRLVGTVIHRSLNLNAYDMDDRSLAEFSSRLQKWRPVMIRGYASALAFLAEFLLRRGIRIPSPKGMISSAETLTDHHREVIERCFSCTLLNRYGSREFADIAQQCEVAGGLHVFTDRLHLEIIRPDGSACGPGERGEIVITDLENRVMPFIRYRTGDLARTLAGTCACGRGFPLLAAVEGRTSELIVGKNGKYYSCQSPRLFGADIPGIGQMQLIQDTIDKLEIKIVPNEAWTQASKDQLQRRMKDLLGEIALEVHLVESIPPAPSGKYPFTISKVSPFRN